MIKKILLGGLIVSLSVLHNFLFVSLSFVRNATPGNFYFLDDRALSINENKPLLKKAVDVVTRPFKNLRLPPLKELLATFEAVFDKVSAMAVSFVNWVADRFKTYTQLADDTQKRYATVRADVKELVELTHKMERLCRNPKDETTRSLCIDNQLSIRQKLQAARQQRKQLRIQYETYQPYLSKG